MTDQRVVSFDIGTRVAIIACNFGNTQKQVGKLGTVTSLLKESTYNRGRLVQDVEIDGAPVGSRFSFEQSELQFLNIGNSKR